MVLSTKMARDLMKTSGLANKKAKNSYKGHKKDNYKKKQKIMNECCICYEKVTYGKLINTYVNSARDTAKGGCKWKAIDKKETNQAEIVVKDKKRRLPAEFSTRLLL